MTPAVLATSPLNDLPGPYEVGKLLGLLVGRRVVAVDSGAVDPALEGTDRVAVYVSDEDELMAMCVCNLSAAAALGSALSMLPGSAAEEAVVRKELPQTLEENLHEVLNVCVRFFNSPYTPHVRLDRVVEAQQGLGPVLEAAFGSLSAGLGLHVRVGDHGQGTLRMLHVGPSLSEPLAEVHRLREQRGCARAEIAAEVVLATLGGDLLTGEARDISLGGTYVTCDEPLEVGVPCTMMLLAPLAGGTRKLRARCRVVRVDATGMALQFAALAGEARAILTALMVQGAAATEPGRTR